jgi:hypothetical protein
VKDQDSSSPRTSRLPLEPVPPPSVRYRAIRGRSTQRRHEVRALLARIAGVPTSSLLVRQDTTDSEHPLPTDSLHSEKGRRHHG